MPRSKTIKRYPIDQSPLYKVTSPNKLASALGFDLDQLEFLASSDNNYRVFTLERSGGKPRLIEDPKDATQRVHRRVADLLSRIEPPVYLHSATKRRSYISNARQHIGANPMVKVDVKTFFPSVKKHAVFSLFRHTMACATDVAGLLSNLMTVNGHLPTGSSASPLLSYYSHKPMFDELADLAVATNTTMTVYIDDMCFSGPRVSRYFLYRVRSIIASHGLKSHKARFFAARKPKEITGVIVTPFGLRLPNRRHAMIKAAFDRLDTSEATDASIEACGELISRLHEAAQIDPRWLPKARQMVQKRREIWARRPILP